MSTVEIAYNALGGRKQLHKIVRTWEDFQELIRNGLPRAAAATFASRYKLDQQDMTAILGVTARTLTRNTKSGHWHLTESDRLVEAAQIFAEVEEMLGGSEPAIQWMRTYNPDLGGKPIDHIDTIAGRQAIKDTLDRIAYGVFA